MEIKREIIKSYLKKQVRKYFKRKLGEYLQNRIDDYSQNIIGDFQIEEGDTLSVVYDVSVKLTTDFRFDDKKNLRIYFSIPKFEEYFESLRNGPDSSSFRRRNPDFAG